MGHKRDARAALSEAGPSQAQIQNGGQPPAPSDRRLEPVAPGLRTIPASKILWRSWSRARSSWNDQSLMRERAHLEGSVERLGCRKSFTSTRHKNELQLSCGSSSEIVLVKQSRDRICHWTSHTAVGSKPDIFKMDPHLTLRFPPFLGKDLPNFGQVCDQSHRS